MMDSTLKRRADKSEELLRDLVIQDSMQIEDISYHETFGFRKPDEVREESFTPCEVGFSWKRGRRRIPEERMDSKPDLVTGRDISADLSLGKNVWFRLRFDLTEEMVGKPVYLKFVADPEGEPRWGSPHGRPAMEALCYRNGSPWQAFDEGRDELLLTERAKGSESFDLLVEVGTTMLWGGLDLNEFHLRTAEICSIRREVRELYWNFRVLNDLRKDLSEGSPNYRRILRGLNRASRTFPFQSEKEEELRRGAAEALDELEGLKDLTSDISQYGITEIGHAHTDAAWLWPWSETVRKCGRTFSNALKLAEEYSEFRFLQSQPHLYEFVKNRYPEIFGRVSDMVKEGRWEPVGGLWVESDTNIVGSESLARQYLMGKRYFREEFGVDPEITFLPDVFGYSPSLPGIADGADCPYFLTQKMSWNERNEFPHHTFCWEGIDGSRVISHFPPADTYNGRADVGEVRQMVKNFKENDVLDEMVYLVGWGDGGGGPTREMLEKSRVIAEIDSLPDMRFGSLKEFFKNLEEMREDLPVWRGELYLEKHRGTLTTQGRMKRNNRKAEFALREAEIWSSIALLESKDFVYSKEDLDRAWKILLFNQFHDILPGSSIPEVYADAERDYSELFDMVEGRKEEAINEIFEREEKSDLICVINSLSWERSPIVEIEHPSSEKLAVRTEEGERVPVQVSGENPDAVLFRAKGVPPMGSKTFELAEEKVETENEFSVSKDHLENSKLKVEFDENGFLTSVYDKEENKEVVDGPANKLVLYRDIPTEFDAWEIDEDVYEVGRPLPSPVNVEVMESGPVRAMVRQEREFGNSRLVQDVIMYGDSKRIDFETYVDWHEDEKLLKAHFPVSVHTDSATYEVQFGHHERPTHSNTSWDEARFEVPHQKWVDLSEYGYGVALLNDCKYGSNVDGTDVSLSLLRAPKVPDPEADQGEHRFTYSLLPHRGDLREAGVIEEAYDLNTPLQAFHAAESVGSGSWIKLDKPGVLIEAVKLSEDRDDELIFRFYEAWGRRTEVEVSTAFDIEGAFEMNLVEDREKELKGSKNRLLLSFQPFEIKTVALKF